MRLAGMTPVVSDVSGSSYKRYDFTQIGVVALIEFSNYYMSAKWKVEGTKKTQSGTVAELTAWLKTFGSVATDAPKALTYGFSRASVGWTWNYLNIPGKVMVPSVQRVIDSTSKNADQLRGLTEQEIINLMEVN